MIKCKVIKDGCKPVQNNGDAAMDLRSAEDVVINPGESASIPLGVAFQFPSTFCGILTHRSSIAFKQESLASYGLIDSTFDSEIRAKIFNLSQFYAVTIKAGERICQIRFTKVYDPEIIFEDFESGGKDGFGSTGKV